MGQRRGFTDSITLYGKQVGREKMADFKRTYEAAKVAGLETFGYDGQLVLVSYAYYLIQYAESEMGPL
jgi:hypothetical protein